MPDPALNSRRFVVGDIHGCALALRRLIKLIDPQPDDEIIFLGDYVDRGPESAEVIELVIDLQSRCHVIALLGNHEIMMINAIDGVDEVAWIRCGGLATLTSYDGSLENLPLPHLTFLRNLLPYHETEHEIFVHASYDAKLSMSEQVDMVLYWQHLGPELPPPHHSGKRVFVGHTPQPNGQVLDVGHLVCVDTYCFGNGCLTAMNLETGETIQADRRGNVPSQRWLNLWNRISCRRN